MINIYVFYVFDVFEFSAELGDTEYELINESLNTSVSLSHSKWTNSIDFILVK